MPSVDSRTKTMADSVRKTTGAPDYDDAAFWDAKFATGRDPGEWLNRGEAALDVVMRDLDRHLVGSTPRVLHLGPGISKLGEKLADACVARQWMTNGIVNVDFSAEAVRLGRESEFHKDMHWLCADLRSWDELFSLARFAPFDIILDKSTSDAISTSTTYTFSSTDDLSRVCPVLHNPLSFQNEITLSPVELLALHLTPFTQKGATWVALSYSSTRFDNLRFFTEFWTIRSCTPLKAPPGPVSSSAHTPDVFHWIYVLDRK